MYCCNCSSSQLQHEVFTETLTKEVGTSRTAFMICNTKSTSLTIFFAALIVLQVNWTEVLVTSPGWPGTSHASPPGLPWMLIYSPIVFSICLPIYCGTYLGAAAGPFGSNNEGSACRRTLRFVPSKRDTLTLSGQDCSKGLSMPLRISSQRFAIRYVHLPVARVLQVP